MQILETALTVGESGSLFIPKNVIAKMGLCPGSAIHIAYLTCDGEENTFRELFLSPDGLEHIQEDAMVLIPNVLLEQANLCEGDDLEILCLDSCILICRDMALNTEDLCGVLEQLERTEELTGVLPFNAQNARKQLVDLIHILEEGRDEG